MSSSSAILNFRESKDILLSCETLRTVSRAAWWRAAIPQRLPLSPVTSLMLRSTIEWTSPSRCLLSLAIRRSFSSASPREFESAGESHWLCMRESLIQSGEVRYDCHSKHATDGQVGNILNKILLTLTAEVFYPHFPLHPVTADNIKRNCWDRHGTIESSMAALNQHGLNLLIDCIIKTVLTRLLYILRFVSVTEFLAGPSEAAVGDVGEVDTEERWTGEENIARVDGAEFLGSQGNAERAIFSSAFLGRLWWLRAQRGWRRNIYG